MTSRSRVAVVLAGLAGVLVLLRVVGSTLWTLVTAPTVGLLTLATVLLLVAALAFLAAATWFAVGEGRGPRRLFAGALVGFLVVMAGYLALGVVLGRQVPWTAYAVLVAVAGLGFAAVTLDRRAGQRVS